MQRFALSVKSRGVEVDRSAMASMHASQIDSALAVECSMSARAVHRNRPSWSRVRWVEAAALLPLGMLKTSPTDNQRASIMAFCGVCGTENRDKARFCMGCAKALAPSADAALVAGGGGGASSAPGPVQTCLACQTHNPLAATVCKSCRGSLVPDLAKPAPQSNAAASRGMPFKTMGAVGLCLAAALVWWSGVIQGAGNLPAQALAAAVSRSASPEAEQSVRVGAAATLSGAAAASFDGPVAVAVPTVRSAEERAASENARAKRQAAAQVRREQAARDRTAAEEQARVAKAREQQRVDAVVRQQAASEATQQARAARVTLQPPPPARVVKTVEQACASSGNFFSREVCRLRSCGDAAFAGDPVCVRFQEMEAANRRAVGN